METLTSIIYGPAVSIEGPPLILEIFTADIELTRKYLLTDQFLLIFGVRMEQRNELV